MTDVDPSLDELAAQEARLRFTRFDDDDAWALGVQLRQAARDAGLPVAISVRRGAQRLFHAALPGACADNDSWLDRKSRVVERFGRSSMLVGAQFRAGGGTFDDDARVDRNLFAAHGGAFPVIVVGVGVVGSVAVSGLPQRADHAFVVEQLGLFLERASLPEDGE